ncbi:MAG: adenine deaminase [Desulfomonilaceae bacterium]
MDIKEKIMLALGNEPVDLLLKNANVVNVFSGRIHNASIAVHKDIIIGFGEYETKHAVDLHGAFVAPGFIDGHIHLESSMLTIAELARNVVPLGTTAVVTDPHEIANVHGLVGIKYILDSSEGLPLRVFVMFPSCVPATPFETSGATLGPDDMVKFREHERILGLAEMMNFPGVILMDQDILKKIIVFRDRIIDGHAPGLSGKDLTAYRIAGIGSDHECCSVEEAREKLNIGMRIMIREGSAAKNLDSLLPLVNSHNSRNIMLVADDLHPDDILSKGHLNYLLQRVRGKGVDPVRAIQMVTINPATYFGLKNVGAILPGYKADLVILEDLEKFKIKSVYCAGQKVSEKGQFIGEYSNSGVSKLPPSCNVAWDRVADFKVVAEGPAVNVIQVVPGQIMTKRSVEKTPSADGMVSSDVERDLLKIAVIERHHGSGAYAVGLIKGFGLKKGAIASSVAHDSHNIVVVGANDSDMLVAAKTISEMEGGLAVVVDGEVRASLPLEIGGLMSNLPIGEVKTRLTDCETATRNLGCSLDAPFATLSFMALTPIPEIKITDQGLFDSTNFQFISLFKTY